VTKAVGYVRVTMRGRGYETQLVRDQTDRLRAWCEMNDLDLEHVSLDSGADNAGLDDRPGLAEALERLPRGGLLIVCSLKKLSPTAGDLLRIVETLKKRRVGLVSLKEDIDTTAPGGDMLLRALGALAAMDEAPPAPAAPGPVAATPAAPAPEAGSDPYGLERRRAERRRAERRRRQRRGQPETDRDGAEAPPRRSVLDTPISELLRRRPASEPPRTFSATWAWADDLVKKGQVEKAVHAWQHLLDTTEGNEAGMALQHLGDLLIKSGRPSEAVERFLEASDVFRGLGLFSKAIASLKRVRKLQPDRVDVYVRIGKLSALCEKYGDATAAYLEVAGRLLEQGDADATLAVFSRVRMLDPVNARHRLQLAAEMIERGLRDEGIEEALFGTDLLRMVGDHEAAERHLRALLTLEPERAEVRGRLEAVRRGEAPVEACPEGAESGVDGGVNLLTGADRSPESAWHRPLDFAPAA
jgi:tetratricopeptide (TPR) repeat protein